MLSESTNNPLRWIQVGTILKKKQLLCIYTQRTDMNKERKFRILFLVSDSEFSYDNSNSAVANYLNTLRSGVVSEGIEVFVYPKEISHKVSEQTLNRKGFLQLLKLSFRKVVPAAYYSLLVRKKLRNSNAAVSVLINNADQIDLVIEFLTVGSQVAFELKRQSGIPYIIIYDSPLLEQFQEMYGTRSLLGSKIASAEKKSVESADGIICYSESVSKYVKNKYALRSSAIYNLPCIVWKEQSAPMNQKEPVIGFIGSFLKWHRVDLLLDAFEQIAKDFPSAKLVLIGYGQEWKSIRQKANDSKFSDRIEMTGYVSEAELQNYKKQFMIGVMPGSNWYGSPLKLFEYAHASIPIIAPETPVVKDLFTAEEVLFVDAIRPLESLIENIRKLLSNDKLRKELTLKCQVKMKGIYSKSEQLNKFNEIIKTILTNEHSK